MKKYSKYISYILLVLWCLVIFYLSNQTSNISGNNSLNVLKSILPNLNDDVLINLNSLFREFMHSGVFFILGILTYISFKRSFTYVFAYSLLFCIFYSLSDEIHQLFVNGRAFELIDLLLDFIGSLLGISLLEFIDKKKSKSGK